jgi:hypothetical protein
MIYSPKEHGHLHRQVDAINAHLDSLYGKMHLQEGCHENVRMQLRVSLQNCRVVKELQPPLLPSNSVSTKLHALIFAQTLSDPSPSRRNPQNGQSDTQQWWPLEIFTTPPVNRHPKPVHSPQAPR